jgi:hypothetical protein
MRQAGQVAQDGFNGHDGLSLGGIKLNKFLQ